MFKKTRFYRKACSLRKKAKNAGVATLRLRASLATAHIAALTLLIKRNI